MQQNSGIIELKDRLVQALDEQCNVKDLKEVNRVISVLERASITREDLERTRLGKYINELRKKTNDKELSKRAKKLIKTWRDAVDATGNNVGSTTSPFLNSTTSNGLAPVLTPNGHPAVARIRSQHLTSPHEKSTSSSSPNNASPSSSNSPTANGKKVSPLAKQSLPACKLASPKMNGKSVGSNLTSPVNKATNHHHLHHLNGHALSQRLSSPSFKNRLANNDDSPGRKGGVNGYAAQQRLTPSINSASSSQHASPLAFTFAKTHPVVLGEYTSVDTNDEDDSNSSSAFFSSARSGLAPEHTVAKNGTAESNTASEDKAPRRARKKKLESAPDSLRDNLKSLLASTSGRRPQSTSEIVQSLNINLNTDRLNSFSASSSPAIASAKTSPEMLASRKRAHFANGVSHEQRYTNGFHNTDEDSNDIKSKRRRLAMANNGSSLPVSPMLIIKKTPSGHYSATSSPAFAKAPDIDDDDSRDSSSFMPKVKIRSPQRQEEDEEDYEDDDDEDDDDDDEDEEDEDDEDELKNVKTSLSTQSMVEREIDNILAQLPPIESSDLEAAKEFVTDEDVERDDDQTGQKVESSDVDSWLNLKRIELVGEDEEDEDWEEFDYDEEYDEEEDEEIEVTDNDDQEEMSLSRDEQHCEDGNGAGDNEPTLSRDNYNCDTELDGETKQKTEEDDDEDEDDFVEVTEAKQEDGDQDSNMSSGGVSIHADNDKQETQPASDASPVVASTEVETTMISNEEESGSENIYLEDPIYVVNHHFLVGPQTIEEVLEKSRTQLMTETIPTHPQPVCVKEDCEPEIDQVEPQVEIELEKPKKTKTIKRRVVRRRKRRVHGRMRIKRSLVDRMANEQWENINGTYDKDGCWREFGQMTSAAVCNAAKEDDDADVLHILPYVNYTW